MHKVKQSFVNIELSKSVCSNMFVPLVIPYGVLVERWCRFVKDSSGEFNILVQFFYRITEQFTSVYIYIKIGSNQKMKHAMSMALP